ncbi:helix-turn-helix transcriptional regulator [Candidatus Phyllobacterium onerii]|uniref:helix-turn-helix transcriptional regulator n=1 Tax=Candidatus Phyllobacterium onerii TaxID=3020828 RepID=UPI00232C5588|nr:LuxR C-terminal-related transcriptional regulator [Phyllobacterium sp. IY22]
MHFNLAHFPDFEEGFISGAVKHDTLEMLVGIRQQLNCRHITHVGHSDQPGPYRGPAPDISVLTTVPTKWVMRYAAKNYFAIDPIMHAVRASRQHGNAPGTIRNLAAEGGLSIEARHFLRDCELRGLGNLYLMVDVSNAHGFRGVTLFSFDIEPAHEVVFVDGMRKRLATVSTRLHNVLHGNRNPGLAAVVAKLLTKREMDCLYWAANGKTDGEIGEILNIARWTVVTYLQNAKNKLGCSNRTSTVATALALGVIEMPAIASRF